jgi:hypothetical protein
MEDATGPGGGAQFRDDRLNAKRIVPDDQLAQLC